MFKTIGAQVWAFDAEWVPEQLAGRLLYGVPGRASEKKVFEKMWEEGGATDEDPTPFLKLILCRVASISAVVRKASGSGKVTLQLRSLPQDPTDENQLSEISILSTFLGAIGKNKPQLVGFNSINADLKILVQRGVALGLHEPAFCKRPNKPWEGIDYFARGSDAHVDLLDAVGGYSKAVNPSLHQLATLSGIPGKMDTDGNMVSKLWLDGKIDEIVRYNEFDALTTYLVWLRMAHFAGHFSASEYEAEQERVKELIVSLIEDEEKQHLGEYLDEWERLTEAVGQRA